MEGSNRPPNRILDDVDLIDLAAECVVIICIGSINLGQMTSVITVCIDLD